MELTEYVIPGKSAFHNINLFLDADRFKATSNEEYIFIYKDDSIFLTIDRKYRPKFIAEVDEDTFVAQYLSDKRVFEREDGSLEELTGNVLETYKYIKEIDAFTLSATRNDNVFYDVASLGDGLFAINKNKTATYIYDAKTDTTFDRKLSSVKAGEDNHLLVEEKVRDNTPNHNLCDILSYSLDKTDYSIDGAVFSAASNGVLGMGDAGREIIIEEILADPKIMKIKK